MYRVLMEPICLSALLYVALKIQKSAQHYTEAAMDEITILKQIAEGDLENKKCVVKLLDHFKHSGPNGQHVCMVFEYLGDNLLTLIKYSDYRGIPLHMVKEICFHILVGLDYLHRELSIIIHMDLKPENILLLSMIDPSKDPRNSGKLIILPWSKSKIKRKAKRATQKGSRDDDLDEIEQENEAFSLDHSHHEGNDSSSESKRLPAPEGSSKRGSQSMRWKLLGEVDLKCKLVDFGNACWTYKQFTIEV